MAFWQKFQTDQLLDRSDTGLPALKELQSAGGRWPRKQCYHLPTTGKCTGDKGNRERGVIKCSSRGGMISELGSETGIGEEGGTQEKIYK